DKILLLGDILYHGPRNELPEQYNPKAVIELLNKCKNDILCVRGNCDTEVDQMVLHFPILADYSILYIDGITIFATHGHLFNEDSLPPLKAGDILVHGHTHIPVCKKIDTYTYMNPGSVSIPKENSYNGYMVLENKTFLWRDFDGNIKQTYSI
ncbi:MAG: phosphodiesterase, partial [Clostridia bacterium]|nr:phosphodiesterase [Clostridia bacterium]